MHCDFEIKDGIYLVQPPHELDLHNGFVFCGLHYSIEARTLSLHWRRSKSEWIAAGTPASISVEFREVSEFRFQPRNANLPFTEDDCVSTFGYWADGVFLPAPNTLPDSRWLTAIDFMSGAVIMVQAEFGYARIEV